jgi:tryptophan synthase alpha chain
VREHSLRAAFTRARAEGRPALVVYVMAGDPSLEATVQLVPRLVEAGADVIELGMPFSDPIADGPVLQSSATRALAAGTTVARVIEAARQIKTTAPLLLMGYLNPLLSYGEERLARDAAAAGVAGAIVPDLPAEEAAGFAAKLRAQGLAFVPLVAPTTPPDRVRQIASLADGFVYYVSVTGVTGARSSLPADLPARIEQAKAAVRPSPLAVGFGISTPEQARQVGGLADGVVVGSVIVRTLQEQGPEATIALVRALRAGLASR